MGFPVKVCVKCDEEFELRPGKPGFANRCPECSAEDAEGSAGAGKVDASEKKAMDEARRDAMRNLLYRKDS